MASAHAPGGGSSDVSTLDEAVAHDPVPGDAVETEERRLALDAQSEGRTREGRRDAHRIVTVPSRPPAGQTYSNCPLRVKRRRALAPGRSGFEVHPAIRTKTGVVRPLNQVTLPPRSITTPSGSQPPGEITIVPRSRAAAEIVGRRGVGAGATWFRGAGDGVLAGFRRGAAVGAAVGAGVRRGGVARARGRRWRSCRRPVAGARVGSTSRVGVTVTTAARAAGVEDAGPAGDSPPQPARPIAVATTADARRACMLVNAPGRGGFPRR